MKTLILTITATGVVAGLCFYAKPRTTKALSTDTVIPFEEQTTGNLTTPSCKRNWLLNLSEIVENRLQSLSHFDIVHL